MNNRLPLYISWFAAGLLISSTAHAQFGAKGFSQEGPTFNRQVRNLGMGNVGVSIPGSHGSSAFYNPAGLNDLTKGQFRFLSLTGEISNDSFGLYSGINDDLLDPIDEANTDADAVRALNNYIQQHTGEVQHMRLSTEFLSYTRRNFAVGLLLDERIDLAFRNPVPESFEIRNLGDVGMYVSGAYGFWNELLQLGVTLRPTMRFSLDEDDQLIDYTDVQGEDADGNRPLENQVKKIYKERRFGLAADIGLKSNLAFSFLKDNSIYKMLKPQVGFSWQDLGSPQFGRAPSNRQSIALGASVNPELWKLKNSFAVEFRDLNRELPLLTKLHVGVESRLPWLLSVRAGLNQGYPTAGVGLDLWIASLDAAVYFEEVGRKVREDGSLRYAVNLAFKI